MNTAVKDRMAKAARRQPDVTIEIGGERRTMRAAVATPEEKAHLWPKAIEGYDSSQRKTSRRIPMVILTAVA